MSDFWFADEATRGQAVRAVIEYTALFDQSMALLRESGEPSIREWEASLRSPEIEMFDAAVAAAVDGEPPAPGPLIERIVPAFSAASIRQRQLGALVTLTSEDAMSRARDAQTAASDEIWKLTIIGTIVVVSTLALAGWCAYSIARPLRRLIDRTERIRDGDLSADARRLTGPHDLRRAAATVEELVDNLRLLDAKAVALARYDLEDPVLRDDLVGPLGTSLQRSTAVLRESIAAREELQQRLWHAANHDSLTGIANRSAAIEKLRVALAEATASRFVAVLFVDLDDFKRANDAHGHAAGDEILRVTAARMYDVVRPADIVGRLGGDEFIVGLSGVADANMARSLAERLLDVLRQPIVANGIEVRVGASIGVALGVEGESPSDVMARADLAVYQAKQRNSSIHVYDEVLHREVQTRTTIEKDLAAALASDDELSLHYQPIIDVYTDEVLRVEALLRWHRPGHGNVGPDEFIPAAEMSSLIMDVDRWVLRRAMSEAAQWSGASLHDAVGIAVNVSGRHVIGDSFVPTVRAALDRSGIDPSRVTLELTESVLVDDLERAAANLRAVRDLGVGVYIDDFGTGYTSIAHLHTLPIDGIKIDRSFVSALPNPHELTLVRTVIELGVQLGLTVVAEGVETQEQRAIVASLGCEAIQGFLVGRPCDADAIRRRVAKDRASTRA
jgi:diguanylate cyclase (GGDEF)-like protein